MARVNHSESSSSRLYAVISAVGPGEMNAFVGVLLNVRHLAACRKVGLVTGKSQKRNFVKLGWETGIEPATFGATDRRSTS